MITVTEKALKAIAKAAKEQTDSIRILVKGYGWGGPVFGIALDEQKENDQAITIEERKFVVEKELVEIYKGFSIDYSDSWGSKGFYIRTQTGGSSC